MAPPLAGRSQARSSFPSSAGQSLSFGPQLPVQRDEEFKKHTKFDDMIITEEDLKEAYGDYPEVQLVCYPEADLEVFETYQEQIDELDFG